MIEPVLQRRHLEDYPAASITSLATAVPLIIKEHQPKSAYPRQIERQERMAVVQSSANAIAGKAGNLTSVATLPVVSRPLRPKQIRAATLLVLGQQSKDVAATLGIAPETLSRWKQRPEFEALMRELLQDTIDSARFGLVTLCAESVEHLRGLVRAFDDETALKAISLVLSKVGPVLGVIGTEIQRPRSME